MAKTQTPIADMIAEMLKNCIPLETIMVAVRAMERAVSTRHGVDEAAENRRAWDRAYRRKRRGIPPDPPDFHPTTGGNGETAPSYLSEVKKHAEVEVKKEKKNKGHKLPPDWKPKPHHYQQGSALGLSNADVDERAARMRNWCDANANRSITTKANWDAAFTGAWLKKESSNGNRNSNTRATGHDAILAVATRKARELDGNDAMAGSTTSLGFTAGADGHGAGRDHGSSDRGEHDHQRGEPDAERVREGEIIPPDKNAAGNAGGRLLV